MASHADVRPAFISSPCRVKKLRIPFQTAVQVLFMLSHTAARKSLMDSQALMMVSLTASASIPARSSIVPRSELLPCMKLMKSSTSKTSARIAAKITSVFTLMLVRSFPIVVSPDVILLKFNTTNRAPAVMAMSRNILSTPPSLSDSQTTPLRTLFRTPITLLKALTISRPMPSVSPSVSLVWASQSPHLFWMTVRASVMLYWTSSNDALISLALSTKMPFKSSTVIFPSVAISSSWLDVVPSRLFSRSTASGARSRS